MVEDFTRALNNVGDGSNSDEGIADLDSTTMSGSLDTTITTVVKKYTIFCHLWVPSDIFLLYMYPTNFNFNNLTHHHSTTKYEQFKQLFTSTINTECINIFKLMKDSAGLLFTHLTPALDSTALRDLQKQNVDDLYTPLAPILFQDPNKMNIQGLFKNKVLTQMACILYFGRDILTRKKCGCPPGRGKKLGAMTMTEDMIATCCIIISLFYILFF
ncbi:hypothetical protein HD554DRAFT_2036416 [Boletus coccyginus]|nr:hypothetical protein HD554DRAFT_2036416 [Boletus coccyginus]